MFDWFWQSLANTTSALVFFSIFLAGLTMSVISLVLGHGDHDVGHDTDHDVSHDGEHHDGDHAGESSFFSVGMLSVRGLTLLASGFGGIGFLVENQTHRVLFSSLCGLVGGYIFAFAVLYLLKIFKGQQVNSLVDMRSALGQEAIVALSIPAQGIGQVRLVISGSEMTLTANGKDGQAIPTGTQVKVTSINGATLVVAPLQ